ncbi:MAG TPA: hypothetical protein VE975_08640 [Actinomycetota bacterium]|jgi:hypothetical protein|nr:hypothetical protein [Actinomycetota bacterium]
MRAAPAEALLIGGAVSRERDLFSELRSLDRHQLRRVLIFVKGLLLAMGDEAGTAGSVEVPGGNVTYRLESVRCGRKGCKSCPHGPYWYAYYREGGRLRSRYIGRDLPDEVKRLTQE